MVHDDDNVLQNVLMILVGRFVDGNHHEMWLKKDLLKKEKFSFNLEKTKNKLVKEYQHAIGRKTKMCAHKFTRSDLRFTLNSMSKISSN